MKPNKMPDQVQGEGDYKAARRHRASAETFVKSGKVDKAAHDAAPATPGEEAELLQAERAGESHSKGEDQVSPRAPARRP